MANHITLLSVILALIALTNAKDWCSITCNRNGNVYQHTMCTFKQSQPASRCNRVVKQKLDQSEINFIVNYHNNVRRSADNLPPLVWDETLATVAQRWTNQCIIDHDECSDLQVGRHVGQNIAMTGSSVAQVNLQELLSQWSGEKSYMNRNIIASFPDDDQTQKNVGHYTQMVWRKTTKVGCGYIMYYGPLQGENYYINYLVCNYDVGGNLPGAPVY